jgi:hypothetical protein
MAVTVPIFSPCVKAVSRPYAGHRFSRDMSAGLMVCIIIIAIPLTLALVVLLFRLQLTPAEWLRWQGALPCTAPFVLL